jgi:(E)-4-hydroxy-3-methylbut-2-enyl-diphosphate synthase
MAAERRGTKQIKAGNLRIGSGAPVSVQSMLSVPADDIKGSVAQAVRLANAGCQLIRAAVPDKEAVALIPAVKAAVSVPICADIHFDYRLAVESAAAGADKIRLNPGNIGGASRVRDVAKACREKDIPIRVGVNGGSLEKDILRQYGGPTPQAIVHSALQNIRLLEQFDFTEIVVSVKASDPFVTVSAYELLAEKCAYPLHLGVTEAGTARLGTLKSAAAIGALLLRGIGDTVRISLPDDPVEEVRAGVDLLRALAIRRDRPRVIACPTCGRARIDLAAIAKQVEAALEHCEKDICVAVMGCAVNGPGEAAQADVGIAGGNGCALLFKSGKILRKVKYEQILPALLSEIEKL